MSESAFEQSLAYLHRPALTLSNLGQITVWHSDRRDTEVLSSLGNGKDAQRGEIHCVQAEGMGK